MSLETVQQVLIERFSDTFAAWQGHLAWENLAFTPLAGKPWLAFHFMPVDEQIHTLGQEGNDLVNGMIQIDVNYPSGSGEGESRKTINELRACFVPGTIGTVDQPVTILSRSRSNGTTIDGYYRIPFTVRWKASITRNPS